MNDNFDTPLAIVIISEKSPIWYAFNLIKKPKTPKKRLSKIFRLLRRKVYEY